MHFRPLVRRVPISMIALGLLTLTSIPLVQGSADAATTSSSKAGVLSIGLIRPLSASSCAGNVCINVVGTGLNVSDWSTTVKLTKSMCSSATFLVDGAVWGTGSSVCGTSGQKLSTNFPNPGNFPNGTTLCNTWSGISGEPCATVHS